MKPEDSASNQGKGLPVTQADIPLHQAPEGDSLEMPDSAGISVAQPAAPVAPITPVVSVAPAAALRESSELESEPKSEPPVIGGDDTVTAPRRRDRFSAFSPFRYNRLAFAVTGAAVLIILAIGAGSILLAARHNGNQANSQQAANYSVGDLPVSSVKASDQLQVGDVSQLAINGQLKVNDTLVIAPGSAPSNPVTGQIFYDQATNQPYYYNGTSFVSLAPQHVTSLGGLSGVIGLGGGLTVSNGQLSAGPHVSSLQGQTGDVTLSAGPGISLNGTTIANSGVRSLAGTANQVGVSAASGDVTLSLPQDIATTSSPAFSGLTVSGTLAAGTIQQVAPGTDLSISAGSDDLVFTAGGRTFTLPTTGPSSQTICTSGYSCAVGPGTAVQLQPGTAQADSGSGSSIFINNTGGGKLIELQGNGGDSFVVANNGDVLAAGNLTVQGGSLTLGTATSAGSATLQDGSGHTGTIQLAGALPGGVTYKLPVPVSAGTQTLCTVELGNCAGSGSGVTTPGGTAGVVAMFTGSQSIADSILSQGGTTLTAAGNLIVNAAGGFTGNLLNLEIQGSSKLSVDQSGSTILAGTLTVNGPGASSITGSLSVGDGLNVTSGGADITGGATVTGNGTITGTLAVQGASALTLGTASVNTGEIIFQGSGGNGRLTLAGPTIPSIGNYTLSIPLITSDDTICTNTTQSTACPDYAPASDSGNYIWNGTVAQTADFNISGSGTVGSLSAGGAVSVGGDLNVSGTAKVATLGTTDSTSLLCLDSSNLLAGCSTTGAGAPFVQGGNNFGATAVLGTKDNNGLDIITNGGTVASLSATGQALFQNTTDSATAFQIQNVAGTSNLFVADTTDSKIGIGIAPAANLGILQIGSSGSTTAGQGITFGGDTDLYRSANNTLTTDGGLLVGGREAIGNGTTINGTITLNVRETRTDTASTNAATDYGQLTANPAANSSSDFYGGWFVSQSQAGNTHNFSFLSGLQGNANHNGTGTVDYLIGASGSASNQSSGTVNYGYGLEGFYNNSAGGTTGSAVGIATVVANDGSGTITNGYGLQIYSAGNYGSGSFENNYGLYIQDQSGVGSVSSYNLYSAGATAQNYFEGDLQVASGNLLSGTAGSIAGQLQLANTTNTNLAVLQADAPSGTGNATYTLPAITGGTSDEVCLVDLGNCAGSGGGITGSGTSGAIAVFDGTHAIESSTLSQSGSTLTAAGNLIVQGASGLELGEANTNAGALTFDDAGSSHTLTLQSGSLSGNLTLTLPTADGSDGDCLLTDGSGHLSFSGCTGGAGGGVTSLNTLSGVLKLQGTTDEISVTDNGSDTLTLSLPQDIATTSSPSFAALTATGTIQGNVVNATGTNAALELGGADINTGGTLSNVAYLDQANTFSQSQTVSAAGGKTTLALTSTGSDTGITLGGDTNLYRGAANTLETDDSLTVGTNLTVSGTTTLQGATTINNNLTTAYTNTSTDGGGFANNSLQLNVAPSSALTASADYIATLNNAYSSSANVANSTRLFGSVDQVAYSGTGTLGAAIGTRGITYNTGSGTVKSAEGLDAVVENTGAGTIQNAYGLNVESFINSGTGTIQEAFGIYVAPQAAGSDNYAIYTGGTTPSYFGGAVTVAAGDLSLGTAGTSTGSVVFYNAAGSHTITLQGPTTDPGGDYTLSIPVLTADDTICTVTSNPCSASGTAGGDLSGNYPSPKVSGLDGTALAIASLTDGDVLQYDGSNWVNGLLTNDSLAAGDFSNIQGVGALTAGSIGSGFGTISTANTISTTSTLHGDTLTAGSSDQFQVDADGNLTIGNAATVQGPNGLTLGVSDSTPGLLSFANSSNTNLAVLQADAPSGTGNATYTLPSIAGGSSDTVCLYSLGNCAAAAGVTTPGGTVGALAYFTGSKAISSSILSESSTTLTAAGNLIVNAASGFSGDLVNLAVDGSSEMSVDQAGNSVQAGTLTVNGTGASAVAGSLAVGTGLTVTTGGASVTGPSTFSTGGASNSVIIQGVASQSADLLALQDSGGNVLSFFDKDGNLTVGSTSNVLTISSPGAGAGSEHFGAGSDTGTYANSLAVGNGAYTASGGAVALGTGAHAYQSGVAIGNAAATSSTASVVVGYNSSAAYQSVALGADASAGTQNVVLGNGATATSTHQLVIGSNAVAIQNAYIGNGVTNASPTGFTLQATSGSGANVAGASLTLAGGQGTGTGVGGDLDFQVALAGTTGSSLNSLQTVCTISGTDGTFSCPGSGTDSEHFGAGSSVGSSSWSLAVGYNATVSADSATALGYGASATGAEAIALGATSSAAAHGVAIGGSASASAHAIAIGLLASASTTNGIALGEGATTTAANQLVIGANNNAIQNAYIGNGVTNASPVGFTLQATGGSGTDIAGASLSLAGGQGTGAGNGGDIDFQVALAGASGTGLNDLQTACLISGTDGTFSCPGSGTGSERFGAGSSVGTAAHALAIGYNATVSGDYGLALGNASSAVGAGVALGSNSTASGGGGGAIAIGHNAAASASGIALGFDASAANAADIALGRGATATAANQLVVGSTGYAVQDAYFGSGVTATSPTGITLHATGGSGTDIQGASLTLAGGQGTGAGSGGDLDFKIAARSSSGSTLNSLSTVFSLSGTDGSALFKGTDSSVTAFRVQDSSGNNLLTADTENNHVIIGTGSPRSSPTLLILGKGDSGDPTCIDGGMYYNTLSYQAKVCLNGSWAAMGVPVVTSLPTSPSDGDEVYYETDVGDSTDSYWHLRYNSSGNYWDFLGGPSIYAVASTSETTDSASYQSTGSPSITLPLGGDYSVSYGASNITSLTSTDNSMKVGLDQYSTTNTIIDSSIVRGSFYASGSINQIAHLTSAASGDSLTPEYLSDTSQNATFYQLFVQVTPIRVY